MKTEETITTNILIVDDDAEIREGIPWIIDRTEGFKYLNEVCEARGIVLMLTVDNAVFPWAQIQKCRMAFY